MNSLTTGLFVLSALALLGSPGPAIAALIGIGRSQGLSAGLRYYLGLQIGLAVSAALCAGGLAQLLEAMPWMLRTMNAVAAAYLVWLAWKIATAPAAGAASDFPASSLSAAGLLMGLSNPKAYLAFVSLLGSSPLLTGGPQADLWFKWLLIVAVIIVVDIAWLFAAVELRRVAPGPAAERTVNRVLGATVLAAAVHCLA
jgi:threonine/homoserine/homoserine lactone efflux protein